jgi:hypothetical protein
VVALSQAISQRKTILLFLVVFIFGSTLAAAQFLGDGQRGTIFSPLDNILGGQSLGQFYNTGNNYVWLDLIAYLFLFIMIAKSSLSGMVQRGWDSKLPVVLGGVLAVSAAVFESQVDFKLGNFGGVALTIAILAFGLMLFRMITGQSERSPHIIALGYITAYLILTATAPGFFVYVHQNVPVIGPGLDIAFLVALFIAGKWLLTHGPLVGTRLPRPPGWVGGAARGAGRGIGRIPFFGRGRGAGGVAPVTSAEAAAARDEADEYSAESTVAREEGELARLSEEARRLFDAAHRYDSRVETLLDEAMRHPEGSPQRLQLEQKIQELQSASMESLKQARALERRIQDLEAQTERDFDSGSQLGAGSAADENRAEWTEKQIAGVLHKDQGQSEEIVRRFISKEGELEVVSGLDQQTQRVERGLQQTGDDFDSQMNALLQKLDDFENLTRPLTDPNAGVENLDARIAGISRGLKQMDAGIAALREDEQRMAQGFSNLQHLITTKASHIQYDMQLSGEDEQLLSRLLTDLQKFVQNPESLVDLEPTERAELEEQLAYFRRVAEALRREAQLLQKQHPLISALLEAIDNISKRLNLAKAVANALRPAQPQLLANNAKELLVITGQMKQELSFLQQQRAALTATVKEIQQRFDPYIRQSILHLLAVQRKLLIQATAQKKQQPLLAAGYRQLAAGREQYEQQNKKWLSKERGLITGERELVREIGEKEREVQELAVKIRNNRKIMKGMTNTKKRNVFSRDNIKNLVQQKANIEGKLEGLYERLAHVAKSASK